MVSVPARFSGMTWSLSWTGTPLAPLTTDRDGRLVIRFASLDQALRALDQGELADYARIELGDEAWAGHVDLEQLLRFRADWQALRPLVGWVAEHVRD